MKTVYNLKTAIGDFYIQQGAVMPQDNPKAYTCWFNGGAAGGWYSNKAEAKRVLINYARGTLYHRLAELNNQMYNIERNLETLPR